MRGMASRLLVLAKGLFNVNGLLGTRQSRHNSDGEEVPPEHCRERQMVDKDSLVGNLAGWPTAIRDLAAGEFLFREGDPKTAVYRVEWGAICAYTLAGPHGEPFLEFAYGSDWLGFGYLDTYLWRARSVAPARVACFPRESVDVIVARDSRARAKLGDAMEREFALVRRAALARNPPHPLRRVAAFLLSLAALSRHEGRDPSIIVESTRSGPVADYLSMSVSELSACLLELEHRGLIGPSLPGGLRLRDLAALEAVAEGISAERTNVPRTVRERSLCVDCHEVVEA
jgi:CRP/FNR family transcriptional regulator, anaerobic regulatory protein